MLDMLRGRAGSIDAPSTSTRDGVQVAPAILQADSRSTKLSVAGFELEGVSIGGQETCIIVPRAKVAFDIGRCPQRAVFQQTVLISHGHMDHIGGIHFHVASRCLAGLPPSTIVLPPHYAENCRQFLELSNKLQDAQLPMPYEVVPLQAEEELVLQGGWSCRAFATSHTITSHGYVLYSQRKKLKAELQGRSQEEIKQLRLSGVEVQETLQVPEIAFTADTTAAFLEQKGRVVEDALRARLLIIEMTFVDDSVSVAEARARGHMHIADFILHAHRFQNEAILLIHFSPRYKQSEIVDALNQNLPPALRAKCVPFLNGFAA